MAYNDLNPTLGSTTEFIGTYAKGYIDAYSLSVSADEPVFKTQVYPQLYQSMGGGTKMFDILRAANREMFVQGRRLVGFEQPRDNSFVTLATKLESNDVSNGYGAGDTIYFKLSSGDYDANRNSGLRTHFTIFIPGKYYGMDRPVQYLITAKTTDGTTVGGLASGIGANTVYTAKPFGTTADLTTDVPVGEKILIGPSAFGTGAGQPDSLTEGYLQRDFYTQISKETIEIEGGANSHERIKVVQVNGENRLFDKAMIKAEFNLDKQVDQALLFAESNENSVTATNTRTGSATTVLTTKGLFPIVDELGQEMVLNGGWSALEDWDALKSLHQSQGTTSKVSMVYCGSTLYSQIENNLLDEMVDRSDAIYDKELQTLGVPFKKVNKGGHLYYLVELDALSNPIGYGIAGYELDKQGIVVPMGDVAGMLNGDPTRYNGGMLDMGKKIMLPNMAVAYLGGYGEDRRSIVKTVAGPNGMGYEASHEYDVINAYLLREYMFFLMKANELIWIHA